jgi:hypothetical protein
MAKVRSLTRLLLAAAAALPLAAAEAPDLTASATACPGLEARRAACAQGVTTQGRSYNGGTQACDDGPGNCGGVWF